jgi:hypothetical protein
LHTVVEKDCYALKDKAERERLPYAALRRIGMRGRASAVVVAAAAAGCAAVTTADGERLKLTSQAFADYAEQVFRAQNRVATDLAFALEDIEPGDPRGEELADAEDALLTACDGLNAAAAAVRDDQRLAVRRRLEAAKRVPDCERATASAAALLRGG